jgi:hypothetical protein
MVVNSEPVSGKSTDKNPNESNDRVCEWATHILWFVVCAWLGVWIGYYKAFLPPNPYKKKSIQNLTTPTDLG